MSGVCCGLVPTLVIILVALSLTSSGGAKAQQNRRSQEGSPQSQEGAGTTIRLGAQLVNVLFRVTNKRNRYINDPTASDMKALQDGKPQEIFTFKRESDPPLTMAILVDVSYSVAARLLWA
jgi:hypothetical protein